MLAIAQPRTFEIAFFFYVHALFKENQTCKVDVDIFFGLVLPKDINPRLFLQGNTPPRCEDSAHAQEGGVCPTTWFESVL